MANTKPLLNVCINNKMSVNLLYVSVVEIKALIRKGKQFHGIFFDMEEVINIFLSTVNPKND